MYKLQNLERLGQSQSIPANMAIIDDVLTLEVSGIPPLRISRSSSQYTSIAILQASREDPKHDWGNDSIDRVLDFKDLQTYIKTQDSLENLLIFQIKHQLIQLVLTLQKGFSICGILGREWAYNW